MDMYPQYPQNHIENHSYSQWIGLRENLQETIDFPIKYGGFPVNFPLNQSIDTAATLWSLVSHWGPWLRIFAQAALARNFFGRLNNTREMINTSTPAEECLEQ